MRKNIITHNAPGTPGAPAPSNWSDADFTTYVEDIAQRIENLDRHDITTVFERALRFAEARDAFRYYRDEGGFKGWAENRLGYSDATAYDLVHVAEMMADMGLNVSDASERFGTLPIRAIYLIARKSTPGSARDEVVERAKAGKHLSYAAVAEIVRKTKNATIATSGSMAATEAPDTVALTSELPGAALAERAKDADQDGEDQGADRDGEDQGADRDGEDQGAEARRGKVTTNRGEGGEDDSARRRKAENAALHFWAEATQVQRQIITEKALAEYIATLAADAKKFENAKPDSDDKYALDKHKDICGAFIEALGAVGFCKLMPAKIRDKLDNRKLADATAWLVSKSAEHIIETIKTTVSADKASLIRSLLPVREAPKPRAEAIKPKKLKSQRACKRASKRNGESNHAKPIATKPARVSDPETLLKNWERLSTQEIEDRANEVRRFTGRGIHLSQAQWKRLHVMEAEVKARRKTETLIAASEAV